MFTVPNVYIVTSDFRIRNRFGGKVEWRENTNLIAYYSTQFILYAVHAQLAKGVFYAIQKCLENWIHIKSIHQSRVQVEGNSGNKY